MRGTTVLCIREHEAMQQYNNATIQTWSYIVSYNNTRIQGRIRLDWYHFGPDSARRKGKAEARRAMAAEEEHLGPEAGLKQRLQGRLPPVDHSPDGGNCFTPKSPSLGGALAAGGGEVRKPQPVKGKEQCVANRLRPEDTERP